MFVFVRGRRRSPARPLPTTLARPLPKDAEDELGADDELGAPAAEHLGAPSAEGASAAEDELGTTDPGAAVAEGAEAEDEPGADDELGAPVADEVGARVAADRVCSLELWRAATTCCDQKWTVMEAVGASLHICDKAVLSS